MSDVLTPTATSSLHVAYTQQGNQAGNSGEEMVVDTRIQISLECQKRTGQAGHRNAQVQNGYLRQRLFLMKRLSRTEEMYGAHFEE